MIQSAVVRVFATTQSFDYEQPWQRMPPATGTGSGVVIRGGRVLTGAHVVADATFLQVQLESSPERFVARLVGVSHDADLALLEVEDEAFADGIEPAVLGGLPDLQEPIRVVGFPVGGEEVSITGGVVSRVEVQRYAHSQRSLLAVTVDAAINSGNSGGPVVDQEGRVVGIAFQSLEDAENIGEMVPVPLIERFLAAIDAGRSTEVPGLGISIQSLENPALRRALGLGSKSGLRVQAVDHGTSCSIAGPGDDAAQTCLMVDDVLLAVEGHPIANNGTIRYRDRFRTTFDALLGERSIGDRLQLDVWRRNEQISVEIELRPYRTLVPSYGFDLEPLWLSFGGVIFQELSRDYLRTWGDRWWDRAPNELLHHEEAGIRTPERQGVVILSQFLAGAVNVGYADFEDEVLVAIDGRMPVDLVDLARSLDAASGAVEFKTSSGARIVFDADEARRADEEIRDRYGLTKDRSGRLAELIGVS